MVYGRMNIYKITNTKGQRVTNKDDILLIQRTLEEDMNKAAITKVILKVINQGSEDIPEDTLSGIKRVLLK